MKPRLDMDYKSSGVDVDAGNEVVQRVKRLAQSTFTPGVLSGIGSFGGLFQPDFSEVDAPVLVASADGVGTKLKIGFLAGRHDTVGADLVNHCVNDILVQGAKPLFFLDYLATGRLSVDVSTAVIGGVAAGCRDNRCALLGGETAEMPGFYADGEYDLAGFIVGMVGRSDLIDGRQIEPGDQLLGLPSSGLHTNGFSLARRIMFDVAGLSVDSTVDDVEAGATVGDVLLRPHRSYLKTLSPLLGGRGRPTHQGNGSRDRRGGSPTTFPGFFRRAPLLGSTAAHGWSRPFSGSSKAPDRCRTVTCSGLSIWASGWWSSVRARRSTRCSNACPRPARRTPSSSVRSRKATAPLSTSRLGGRGRS